MLPCPPRMRPKPWHGDVPCTLCAPGESRLQGPWTSRRASSPLKTKTRDTTADRCRKPTSGEVPSSLWETETQHPGREGGRRVKQGRAGCRRVLENKACLGESCKILGSLSSKLAGERVQMDSNIVSTWSESGPEERGSARSRAEIRALQ